MTYSTPAPRVLIIGAGPAGLGAIPQLLNKGFDVVAYDDRERSGGLWNYEPSPPEAVVRYAPDGHAVLLSQEEHEGVRSPSPSPMYASVYANTPRDVMTFRSHPFPPGTPFSPSAKQIKAYLDRWTEKYEAYIRHGRVVTRVRHNPEFFSGSSSGNGNRTAYGVQNGIHAQNGTHSANGTKPPRRWKVDWTPTATSTSPDVGKTFTETFDYIVVANGSDSRPYIPWTEGLWNWKGEILHSRWYRNAADYAGKNVLVVGSGSSSSDIVRELGMLLVQDSAHAPRKVYRSIRSTPRLDVQLEKGWRDRLTTVGPIKRVFGPRPGDGGETGRIEFKDGTILDDIDVIIFATSYLLHFDFLRSSDAPFNTFPVLTPPRAPGPDVRTTSTPVPSYVLGAEVQGGRSPHNLDSNQLFYLPDPSIAFLLLHCNAISWPFAELQAHVAAAVWSGQGNYPFIPHPLAEREGEEDGDGQDVLHLGWPGEFTYATRILRQIGEGGPEEVDAHGNWGEWPEWKKEIRRESSGSSGCVSEDAISALDLRENGRSES